MATYAIGDIQGCYSELCQLLEHIQFDEKQDTLWLVGDLINRGPESLATLRFIKNLPNKAVVLGNHDLHLIAMAWGYTYDPKHTLHDVAQAPDFQETVLWLRQLPLAYFDAHYNTLMVHAGVLPQWDLDHSLEYAREVEQFIQDDEQIEAFIRHMHSDRNEQWTSDLTGWKRLRVITNVFTRMRLCSEDGIVDLKYKGKPKDSPSGLKPWFEWRSRAGIPVIFGHWAALEGKTGRDNAIALDTGCIWGNTLTAYCLDDSQTYSVPCLNGL